MNWMEKMPKRDLSFVSVIISSFMSSDIYAIRLLTALLDKGTVSSLFSYFSPSTILAMANTLG